MDYSVQEKPTSYEGDQETLPTSSVSSFQNINIEDAQVFLDVLDPAGRFTFQTFDDNPERKDRALLATLHGTLSEHARTLTRLNQNGAGVFVTVNATDFRGRRAENVTRVRALFADFDDQRDIQERVTEATRLLGVAPSMTIISSLGKHHMYWLVEGSLALDDFRPLQQALAARLGSDAKVIDLPRVMRLPGFWHRKREAYQSRLFEAVGRRYTISQLKAALPVKAADKGVEVPAIPTGKHYAARALERAVASIVSAAEGSRNDTLNREAYGIFGLVKAHCLNKSDARLALEHAGVGAGLSRGEVLATLTSAWRAAKPRAVPELKFSAGALRSCARREPAPNEAFPEAEATEASDAAQRLANDISDTLAGMLKGLALPIDARALDRMLKGAVWSGGKGKIFLLNESESLVQFPAQDAYKFLCRRYGAPVEPSIIASVVGGLALDSTREANETCKRADGVIRTMVMDHLKYENQRDSIEWRCDMYAEHSQIELLEDKARIVLTHKPFPTGGYEEVVIADYKQHFPRFDEFLNFLVASRFALDRKKSYLWILADSDWGKGFLLGILNELNAAVGTSMKEIEAMFEGRPVGRTPEDFKRALALVIDEFKTVKSELKQLQSQITLAPKNQLTATVEVFAKVFLSAESVASLVTENGVEDQFANRMSIYRESGSLAKRPYYVQIGGARYFESVKNYAAERLNAGIDEMRKLDSLEAQTRAQRWLDGFISRNGLDTIYERFSDSFPRLADDIISWLHKHHGRGDNMLAERGVWYLRSPAIMIDHYLEEHFGRSEIGAYSKRKDEIMQRMSANGKGRQTHRVNGRAVTCVMLKPLD